LEIWIPVIVAVVSSIASFLAAIATSKNDLKKLKQQHELDLKSLKEKHSLDMQTLEKQQKHDLDKINAELDSQGKLYEQNKQTDMIAGFMENPAMQGIMQNLMMQELGIEPPRGTQKKQQNRRGKN